jgi:hypothetical protein
MIGEDRLLRLGIQFDIVPDPKVVLCYVLEISNLSTNHTLDSRFEPRTDLRVNTKHKKTIEERSLVVEHCLTRSIMIASCFSMFTNHTKFTISLSSNS